MAAAARDALLIVDMQVALFRSAPRHDAAGLVARLNRLARRIRGGGGRVVWVRHTEPSGDYAAGTEGWQILPELEVDERDAFIGKATCDCFQGTGLAALIPLAETRRLIVTGCATDFCVDTSVRSAAVRGYDVWAPGDGHTTADRPHLAAEQIIRHHNYVWSEFIGARGPVDVAPVADGRFHGGDLEAKLAEHHPVGGGAAAGMERDPLLDRSPALDDAIFQVEDVAPDLAGDGPARVGDAAGDAAAGPTHQPPDTAAGGLPLLLDHLIQDQRPALVDPTPAMVAHLVRPRHDHLHDPRAFGAPDEEMFGGGRCDGRRGRRSHEKG
jgi:nicotinamidase-related amidase